MAPSDETCVWHQNRSSRHKHLSLTLNESLAKETFKAFLKRVEQQIEMEGNKGYYDVLHAPYVKGFSEGLQRKLRKLQVGLVPKSGETLNSNLCKGGSGKNAKM